MPSRPREASLEGILRDLTAKQLGVFSRRQASERGVSDGVIGHALQAGRVERVYRGTYRMTTSPTSWEQSLVAACLSPGEGTFASHRAAARLWALEGVDETPLEITTMHDVRHMPGIIVHRVTAWPPCDMERRAIPLTKPERTLLDLAGVIPVERLEVALDDALRRRLTTVRRLQWRLSAIGTKGKVQSNVLRMLLAERPVGAAIPESVLETRLLRLIATARLPLPEKQYAILSCDRFVARVDFAYPRHKVAIEADGYRYHSGRQVWARDLARRNALQSLGWVVLHFTHHQVVSRREEVVDLIATALSRATLGD
ncbi:MAG: DUF559 domain-containing protein [Actinomycetota bacterium]|nr:DUF559 domain-containing protein [Actinomycetota bacterium]